MSKLIRCGLGQTTITGTRGVHRRKRAICEFCNPEKDRGLRNIWYKVQLSNLVHASLKHEDFKSYWICQNCESLKSARGRP